ncbi:hypothetical protein Csa_012930 [Cucumis sativus]|uniref:Uncharacterized protein n=1 Tax=Cucumis sativus TaxID=3659 RepID=A0A0A0L0G4_CUCSA|nr:hypothetical protein Csa_012930 [Cucumis sativus]
MAETTTIKGMRSARINRIGEPATAISQPADEEVARHTTTCSCRIVNGDRRNQNAIRIQRTTCNLQQMIHDEGMACSREMAYGDSQLGCATRTEERCSGDRTKRKDQTLAESWILDGTASQI